MVNAAVPKREMPESMVVPDAEAGGAGGDGAGAEGARDAGRRARATEGLAVDCNLVNWLELQARWWFGPSIELRGLTGLSRAHGAYSWHGRAYYEAHGPIRAELARSGLGRAGLGCV